MMRNLPRLFFAVVVLAGPILVAGSPTSQSANSPVTALQTPAPAAGTSDDAAIRKLNYLHTEGNRIVDASGREVTITGLSWFGFETNTLAPHGLWARPYEEILDHLVEMGFNTIRLPFSNEMLDTRLGPQGVDPQFNKDLEGLTSLELMDKIILAAGQRGLKVILDRHRPSSDSQSKLWYTDEISEEQWIADWTALVRRYKDNDTVIGVDLHNEPAGEATWGTGDPITDWRLAAERAGNAVLAENPNLLIIVEGIERVEDDLGNVMDWYWMGGALQLAKIFPVRLDVPNRLVYSAHDYGPGVYPQGWFNDPEFPANLPGVWDHHWGYLHKEGTAPVILGEFGGKSIGDDPEGVWQRSLIQYLKENNIGYLYWSLNGNSGDTGGILKDDWKSADLDKLRALSSYQAELIGNFNPGQIDLTAAPGPRPASMKSVKLLQKDINDEKWTKELKPEIHVANKTGKPLGLDGFTARYWFTADGSAESYVDNQVVEVTGVSIGYPEQQLGRDKAVARLVLDPNGEHSSDPQYYVEISFAPGVEVPARDTLAVHLSVRKRDGNPYFQENDYSYRNYHWQSEWDRVALYQDGDLLWGIDPQTFQAQVREKQDARRARLAAAGE